jgi:hypothetical protein
MVPNQLPTIDEYLDQLEMDEPAKIRHFLSLDDLTKHVRFTKVCNRYDGIFYGTEGYYDYYFRDDIVNFFHKFEKYNFVFDVVATTKGYSNDAFNTTYNWRPSMSSGETPIQTYYDPGNLNSVHLMDDFTKNLKYDKLFLKFMKVHKQYINGSDPTIIKNVFIFDRVQYLSSIPIIEELYKKINRLKDQINYSPGGIGYTETYNHFNSIILKDDN